MKRLITEKKRKFLRYALGLLSFSSCLFIFQACYGTAQDFRGDVYIHGIVKSKKTQEPINGIKVSLVGQPNFTISHPDGSFSMYCDCLTKYQFEIEDIDSVTNKYYSNLDTLIADKSTLTSIEIYLNEK